MRRHIGMVGLLVAVMACVSFSGCIWYRHWVIRREVQEVKKDVQELRGGWVPERE